MQDYKRLHVWAKAHALVLNTNRVIRAFPREHRSLSAQLRRSVESVATNIVEGAACVSQKEFARFLQISISSSSEVEYQLRIARDYGILSQGEWENLTRDTQEVRRMLTGLIKKVRGDIQKSVPV